MSDTSAAESGNAEVAERFNKELAKGYVGTVPDTTPNSAYSLTSGPEAPPLIKDNTSRAEQFGVPTTKDG